MGPTLTAATLWIATAVTWGVPGGLAVGIDPADGPRGLIRVYAPFLGHGPGRVLNFTAVEPVVNGKRGYSELESSAIDGKPGLVFTASATVGREVLRVRFSGERFGNGARSVIEVRLRRARPREVEIAVNAAPGSARTSSCILTATMGNFARLRRIRLRDGVAVAGSLWTGSGPDPNGFFPHRKWPADRLPVSQGRVELAAAPDETDPAAATYDGSVDPWWRYTGIPARQVWRTRAVPGLVARVNARSAYYGTNAPIPGGLAFENVEFEAPFRPGQVFTFSVEPLVHDGAPR